MALHWNALLIVIPYALPKCHIHMPIPFVSQVSREREREREREGFKVKDRQCSRVLPGCLNYHKLLRNGEAAMDVMYD